MKKHTKIEKDKDRIRLIFNKVSRNSHTFDVSLEGRDTYVRIEFKDFFSEMILPRITPKDPHNLGYNIPSLFCHCNAKYIQCGWTLLKTNKNVSTHRLTKKAHLRKMRWFRSIKFEPVEQTLKKMHLKRMGAAIRLRARHGMSTVEFSNFRYTA